MLRPSDYIYIQHKTVVFAYM